MKGAIPDQILKESSPFKGETRKPTHRPPGAHDAHDVVFQVLWQIGNGCSDARMCRTDRRIRSIAQRIDLQVEATRFEASHLLSNRRLGQTRPALNDDRDLGVRCRLCVRDSAVTRLTRISHLASDIAEVAEILTIGSCPKARLKDLRAEPATSLSKV